jgi:hypothetical protein
MKPLFLALVACLPGASHSPTAIAPEPASPSARRIVEERPGLHFIYFYPSAAAAIPEIRAMLETEASRDLTEARDDVKRTGASRKRGKVQSTTEWELAADSGDLLVLRAVAYAYYPPTPHGRSWYRTLIWSRSSARALELPELFSDAGRAGALLDAEICPLLNAKRTQRWIEQGNHVPEPLNCADYHHSMLPSGGRGVPIARWRLLLTSDSTPDGYAGGDYEIEFPVSAAVRTLIKPEYRSAFGS